MIEVRLALIGYGNVAQGLTQILLEQGEEIARQRDLSIMITAITDPLKGNAFNPEGLDPAELLDVVQRAGALHELPGDHPDWDAMEMIQNSPSDVVVELSYTDLNTGEPATTYISEALRRKKHVVTTNKGPIALHWEALAGLAHQHNVQIGLEGTVMSGTPVLQVGMELLAPANIRRVEGIFNGTTNFILSEMEKGASYTAALAEAQAQGYAEADPTNDVEGFDAAAKVAILARLLLKQTIPFTEIERQGITGLTDDDMAQARANDKSWKLVASLDATGEQVRASVRPECLPKDHPLARIGGATNAIVYSTDLLGDVVIIGPGAGRLQTGYAIIQDLFCIYRDRH